MICCALDNPFAAQLAEFIHRGLRAQRAVDTILQQHHSGGPPMARPKTPRKPRKAYIRKKRGVTR